MKGSISLSENAVTRSARSPSAVASSSEMPMRVGEMTRRLMRRARAASSRRGSTHDSTSTHSVSKNDECTTR